MNPITETVMRATLERIIININKIKTNLDLYEAVVLKTSGELQEYLQQKNDILAQYPELIPIEEPIEEIIEEPIITP